jgi:hypothetical protein
MGGGGGYQKPQYQQNQMGGGYSNYRTVLCKFFAIGKECPYGIKCNFAHGETELKPQQPYMGGGGYQNYNAMQSQPYPGMGMGGGYGQ